MSPFRLRRLNVTRPLVERVPDDEEERLSLYPLSFEEALQAVLAVDPRKVGTDPAEEISSGDDE
jgi:hypothetical protein